MAEDKIEIDDADLERLLADPEDDEDAGDDTPPDGWKPLSYAETQALRKKASDANGNAKNLRLKFGEYRKQFGPKPAPPKTGAPAGGEGDKAKTEAEIRAELAAEYKAKQDAASVQTEAVTALVAAGLQLPKDAAKRTAAARKAIRLMDLDGVEPGDTAGIAQAIEDLQDEYPGLFAAAKDEDDEDEKPARRKARQPLGGPAARTKRDEGKPLSNNEQLARALQRSGAFKQG